MLSFAQLRRRRSRGWLGLEPSMSTSHLLPVDHNALVGLCLLAGAALIVLHIHLYRVVVLSQQQLDVNDSLPLGPFIRKVRRNHTSLKSHSKMSQRNNATTSDFNFHSVSPLTRPIDFDQYTIRINSWKRTEQLQVSLDHFSTCAGVAQIQVVWCDDQGPPPEWLVNRTKPTTVIESNTNHPRNDHNQERAVDIVLERHTINSLNERFRILHEPPTAAILSIDDDVLRPCLALDVAFDKWRRNPDRMVGFDARTIVMVKTTNDTNNSNSNAKWMYGFLSTTEKTNQYALTLTRFAFVHRDYLDSYFTDMPAKIRETVDEHLNCEDIALSMWVSAHSKSPDTSVPLLADYWAIKSQVKLYSPETISGSNGHKRIRDDCVNDFADLLRIKEKFKPATFVHHSGGKHFECGAKASNWNAITFESVRIQQGQRTLDMWKSNGQQRLHDEFTRLSGEVAIPAYKRGLIKGTEPWEKRFQNL